MNGAYDNAWLQDDATCDDFPHPNKGLGNQDFKDYEFRLESEMLRRQ